MSKFQFILLGIFGVFIIVAVLVFSLYKGSSGSEAKITIWGSISNSEFNYFLNKAKLNQDNALNINYLEKDPKTLLEEFTEALARGAGPDLIIIPQDELWQARNKLQPIPYKSISERVFKETFVEGAEIFLSESGVYAMPLSIDPLVLYYNRDILSSVGIAKPLAYWDEVYASTDKINKRDPAGNLVRSTIALGETRNLPHYKDIFSLLLLQAGTPITALVSGELRSMLTYNSGLPVVPAESALDFYTQFANPAKTFYSWNRVLPEASKHFASGDLAYYLGYASEVGLLRRKSPTLNFSVAPVPQSRVATRKMTYGRFYGVAISRGTPNPNASLQAIMKLVSKDASLAFSESFSLPPARRDLLAVKPTDVSGSVFYESALQARSWLDPRPEATATIFQDLIESVTSGRLRLSEALRTAHGRLEELTKK